MTRADWKRVRAIVEAALALAGTERQHLVDEQCGDDSDLRDEVLSFLEQDAAPDSYLDTPHDPAALRAAVGAEPFLDAGTRLGPWVLREPIASGGMGTVYRAERADRSFEKTVAIKLIKAGMDSAELLARFANERRVLAELEHPGIARLLDAGTSERGRPYFVMELVEGRPIDRYAAEKRLDVRARVELFCTVCDAVHAAHQALIVHRDLKPDNILVTAEGRPKLLDFGIAKALQPDHLPAGTAHTLGPSRVMTPEYASPEQICGEQVTTASDVYSLGVVLYELVTGERPLDYAGATRSEIERIAREQEPARPSTRTGETWARRLGVRAPALKKALEGDLDTIVIMALRKAPERRYASAAALADDLRRHLRRQPVLARPDTFGYRLSTFVRRNRTMVLAAALVVAALTSGLVVSLIQADRARRATLLAEERFDDVRHLARQVLFELDEMLANVDGTLAAREFVVTTSREYLDKLAARSSGDPELRREVAQGYLKTGDVLGGPTASNLGRYAEAMENYQLALALAESLPDEPAVLATCLHRIGLLEHHLGEFERAFERYQRALQLGSTGASTASLLGALSDVLNSLVTHRLQAGDHAAALDHATKYGDLADQLAEGAPEEYRLDLRIGSLTHRGTTLALMGRSGEAEPALREAVSIAREWFRGDSHDTRAARSLDFAIHSLVQLLRAKKAWKECAALLEEWLEISRRLRAADPSDIRTVRDLTMALNDLSRAYANLGRHEENLEIGIEYHELTQMLVDADPGNVMYREDLVGARLALARAFSFLARHEEAVDECLVAWDELEELIASNPEDANKRRNLASIAAELGFAYRRWSEAAERPADELDRLEHAREAFASGVDLLGQLHEEGLLAPGEAHYIESARDMVTKCSEKIDELRATLPPQRP